MNKSHALRAMATGSGGSAAPAKTKTKKPAVKTKKPAPKTKKPAVKKKAR